jgi:hypothetical protein
MSVALICQEGEQADLVRETKNRDGFDQVGGSACHAIGSCGSRHIGSRRPERERFHVGHDATATRWVDGAVLGETHDRDAMTTRDE